MMAKIKKISKEHLLKILKPIELELLSMEEGLPGVDFEKSLKQLSGLTFEKEIKIVRKVVGDKKWTGKTIS